MTIPSRARRVGRLAARLAGVLFALLLAIHLPPVQRAVGRAVARAASKALGGTATVDGLSYRLWRGDARVAGVRIETPALRASAAGLTARLVTWHSVAVELDEPALVLTGQGGASAAPREAPAAAVRPSIDLPAALEQVTIHRGRVDISPSGLALRDIDARLARARGGWEVEAGATFDHPASPGLARVRVTGTVPPVSSDGDVDVVVAADAAGVDVKARAAIARDMGVRVSYDVSVASVREAAETLAPLGVPRLPPQLSGRVAASGDLRFRGDPLATAVGTLRFRDSRLAWRGQPLPLAGALSLGPDGVRVDELVVQSDEGSIRLAGTIPMPGRGREWDVEGRVQALALAPFTTAAELAPARLDGAFCLAGTEPDGQLSAELAWSDRRAAVVARKEGSTIVVDDLRAEGAFAGRAEGVYDLTSRRLEARVEIPALDLARVPQAKGASGVVAAHAQVAGVGTELTGTVDIETHGVSFGGRMLPDTRLRAEGDRHRAVLSYDRGEGAVAFVEVRSAARQLQARVDLARLPWKDLPHREGAPLSVNATGTALLELPLDTPARLRYRLENVTVAAHTDDVGLDAAVSAAGDLRALHVEALQLQSGDDRLEAHGTVGLGGKPALDLDVRGALPLALVRLASPDSTIDGRLTAALHVGGTPSSPVLAGEADADVRRDEGMLRVHGAATPEDGTRVAIECENLRLSGGPEDRRAPRLTAKASAHLTSALSAPPEGEGRIESLALAVGERRVTLPDPAPFAWAHGALRLPPARLLVLAPVPGPCTTLPEGECMQVQGHDVRVQGEVVLVPRLRYSAQAQGTVDLALLSLVLPREFDVGGEADLSVKVAGPEDASFEGVAAIRHAHFIQQEIGLSVSGLEGRARLHDRVLQVEELRGRNGEGTVRVEGHFDIDERFKARAVDLRLVAERLPYAFPKGLNSVVNAQIGLKGEGGEYLFSGDVDVVSGAFSWEAEDTSASTDALDDLRNASESKRPLGARVAIDLDVRTLADVRVRGPRAELAASGRVKVSGTFEDPAVTGSITAASSGRLEMGSSSMMLTEGRVTLEGFPETPAMLELRGRTHVNGVLMDVAIYGRTDELQTEVHAPDRPDLTQGDLASMMSTGHAAGGTTDPAGKVVGDQLLGALGGRLQKRAGDALVVDISTDTSFFAQDTEPTPRFNVGRHITDRLSFIYSAALDRTGSWWIVQLDPNQRIRIRAIAEDDGSFATEISDRLSWTFTRRPSRAAAARAAGIVIGAVGLEGALPLPEERIRKWLDDLREGEPYDAWAVSRAGDTLARKLASEGWRAANVDVVPAPPAEGRRDVRVAVAAGPHLRIVWSGDRVRRKWRRDAEKRWNPRLPLDTAAAELARQIQTRLRARHRLNAQVHVAWAGDDTRKTVTFTVSKGPRGGDVVLDVKGNERVSTEALRKALPDLDSREMLEAYEHEGEGLQDLLRLVYAEKGFPFATVGKATARLDPDSGDLHVGVTVTEGAYAVLRDLTVSEPPEADSKPPAMTLRVGQAFRLSTYVADRDALSAWYRQEGYPEARVTARLTPAADGAALRFEVKAGPRPHVRAVRVAGTDRTRFGVIGRNVALTPGDVVKPLALARTRERLRGVGALASADVRAEPVSGDPDAKDVEVEIKERPDLELAYGLRWQTNSPQDESDEVQVGANVSFNNLLRVGERTTAFAYLAKSHVYYGTSVDFPRRGRLDTQMSLYLDDDSNTEIDGVERLVRAAVLQQSFQAKTDVCGKRFCDLLRLQWGVSFKHYRFIDTRGALAPLPSPFETNRGLISLALMGDTRDTVNDPHRGFLWSAAPQLSLRALGSDVSYLRLYGQFFFHHPLGPLVLATGLRTGLVPGTNPTLLVEDRFLAGGPTTVRAFGQDDLGPRSHTDDPIGGQALVVFNQEVRFPIRDRLKGGLFYDAGNVYARAADFSLGSLRQDVGAGLRLVFPFGPIRLDWAYLLGAKEGESRSRFSFALGHVF